MYRFISYVWFYNIRNGINTLPPELTTILQTIFSNVFSWMIGLLSLSMFCWTLFLAWFIHLIKKHYSDAIMSTIASQITGVSIIYSTICWGADKKNHQSSASLAFVRGIHRWSVNSPHKGPGTRKMFSFDDVIIYWCVANWLFIRQMSVNIFHHILMFEDFFI